MLIERIEIRFLDLPLVEPFVAAHGTTMSREIVVVRIDTDQGHGWGECSALPEPTYTDEFAAGAFVLLDEELAPRLVGHDLTPATVGSRLSVVAGNPMAKAAVEMALLDVDLRRQGQSLGERIGAPSTQVIAGAAVGLGSIDEVVERAADLRAEGYGRLKLKIQPGHDVELVAAVKGAVENVEIHLDANGSYSAGQIEHLVELGASGVSAIEQPFAPGQVSATATLVDRCPIPIVADESATTLLVVEQLHKAGAIGGVSIKPPRLGGLLAAVALHDRCVGWGVSATAGGMVETGLGRHALAAMAALPGFSLAGDISPARRWLEADPWTDLTMIDGMIDVPTGPGVAPDPDLDLLDRYTTKHSTQGGPHNSRY